MTAPSLVDRQRTVLRELARLAQERAKNDVAQGAAHRAARDAAQARLEAALADSDARFAAETTAADEEFNSARTSLSSAFEAERGAATDEGRAAIEHLTAELNSAEKQAKHTFDEARWLAQTVYEGARKRLKQQLAETQLQLQARLQAIQAAQQEALHILEHYGLASVGSAVADSPTPPPADKPTADADPAAALDESCTVAATRLTELKDLSLPKLTSGAGLAGLFVGPAALLAAPIGWLFGWSLIPWLATTGTLALVIGAGLAVWLRRLARQHTIAIYQPFFEATRDAIDWCQLSLVSAQAANKRSRSNIHDKREADLRAAVEKHGPAVVECQRRREAELPRLVSSVDERLKNLTRKHESDQRRAADRHAQRHFDARRRRDEEQSDARATAEQLIAAGDHKYNTLRAATLDAWQQGLAAAKAEIAAIRREVDRRCPEWNSRAWADWHAPQFDAGALRFGRLTFDVRPFLGESAGTGNNTADGADTPGQSLEFALPALYGFPQVGSVYIKAQDAGRQRAVELLQVLMLRLLTTLPPGKARFTIVDPAGLGQNFAAFMHLADFDEALVTHRIWTESHQIEQRLADLTEHMETVIQKYLRNEYATIEAYNAQAGEIAEPFRILVVANFPAGFSEVAVRRLLSIMATGPRCGVYTLLSADARLPRPAGIGPNDLAQHGTVFTATSDRLAWLEPDFKHLPLVVDPPPPADWQKRVLHAVGQAAVGAKRVEVPFEAIAPPRERYWTFDSRRGIDIPLGRVGATRLQHLKLGQGTAQHVLIAGKTGSGKSTLLHALIVNAALRYSPEELELYLIDFKKGVEFKTYVTHDLPHARVVAIESEREFGLSVMQRLDAEMNDRGERFRAAGVQDIAGFRDAGNQLPRILFIVDEFQEFFVADDRLAQEASLLLDRLVRQGRAFGIHVHLGSQTLGGAYSLARSTLGQMAVRIALQCSENDAHLILSEDNTAARLLSRPGEAIYNDANGLVEGNHPFQVVWLPDDRREVFLDEAQRLAEERPAAVPRRPQIVFEGMQPAELQRSEALFELVTATTWPTGPRQPRAWLGEPLAIADATTVTLARRDAANVLFIGQNDEAVAGMLTAALVSLAAQLPPGDATSGAASGAPGAKFVILDGGPVDGPQHAPLRTLAGALPHEVRVGSAVEGPALVAEVFAELERRRSTSGDAPPLIFAVYDLPRLRELRRQEEEFSFSRRGESEGPKPDKQFADILRDGPALGIHVLTWCDTLTNFNRMLERGLIKQFAVRVLLQMSAADSSLLIDTPTASQLGKRRALLHREEEGGLEKFRPFAPPEAEWLTAVGQTLGERGSNDPSGNGTSAAPISTEARGEVGPAVE